MLFFILRFDLWKFLDLADIYYILDTILVILLHNNHKSCGIGDSFIS